MPGSGDVPIPLVHPKDTGNFVRALVFDLPVGTDLLGFGDRLLWADYVKLLSQITGIPTAFEKTTVEEHSQLAPEGYGAEMAEMYGYAQDFGYDGGDPNVIYSSDVCVSIFESIFARKLRHLLTIVD